jgi:hypothetical protein
MGNILAIIGCIIVVGVGCTAIYLALSLRKTFRDWKLTLVWTKRRKQK